jgi:HK97 family phage major capsid protein
MFGEKIKALQTKINQKLDEVEALQTLAEKEDRSFTDDETSVRDGLITEIKALKARKEKLEETESLIATKSVSQTPTATEDPVAPAQTVVKMPTAAASIQTSVPQIDKDASMFFARQAHALFVCGGNRYAAAQYARDELKDELLAKAFQLPRSVVNKATVAPGDSVTTGWAAELVQINQAAGSFIDLLRNASIVARFPGRQMSFGGAGSIEIPRQTGGVSGSWVGEGKAIPLGALSFDDITLTPKKNAVIVAATNELLRRSDPSAMMLIRDDMVEGIAQVIDSTFIDGTAGSATRPAGIQTYDGTPTVSTGSTLDQITADLKTLIGEMNAANLPNDRVWIMSPANELTLRLIRDGLGTYAFQAEMASGTLLGYPLLVSNTVPDDIVMLANASNIIVASELAPQISISQDASLHMEDAPADDIGGATTPVANMFQLDQTAVRCLTTLDWAARRDEVVQVLNTVAW